MKAQLVALVRRFDAARDRVDQLVVAVPQNRWALRPVESRWSVAECIAHLNLTSLAYVDLLHAAFDENPNHDDTDREYRMDFVGRMISIAAGPLPRIGQFRFGRVKTATRFVPLSELDAASVVAEFDELQQKLIALLRDAEGRRLGEIRIVSPFDGRLSYNAYSTFVILERHQRRHLWQAEHVWSDASTSRQAS